MAALPPDQMPAAIATLDERVHLLGHLVISPPVLVKLQLLPIRALESNSVRRILDVLAGKKAAPQHSGV
jgi:hypothetical protein